MYYTKLYNGSCIIVQLYLFQVAADLLTKDSSIDQLVPAVGEDAENAKKIVETLLETKEDKLTSGTVHS